MFRRIGRIVDRFFAILLSILLVLAMLPTSTLSVMAETDGYPDSFTVSITDGTISLEGVTVALCAKESEWSLDLSATTDKDGVAVFETSEIKQALSDAGIDEGTIVYTASMTGYDNVLGEIEITSTDLELNIDVTMTEIQADLDKYTLSVTVSSGDAVVKLNDVEQNAITVEADEEISVEITPAEGTYIKTLTVGEEEKNVEVGQSYISTIKMDQDIEINVEVVEGHKITVVPTENGSIELDAELVKDNGFCEVTVTPNEGYSISSVQIDGVDIVDFEETEEGVITFLIDNIIDSKVVSASFVQTATISPDIAGLFNYTDAIRTDGMTFIYAKDGVITFTTDKTGIRIYDENNQLIGGGKNTDTFKLNESVQISKIQLRYKADGEWTKKWHDVEGVSAQELLKLIIDVSETNSTTEPDEKHSNNFYNDDFDVEITVTDEKEYSGIGCIEYFVTDTEIAQNVAYADVSDDLKTQRGNLYTDSGASKNAYSAVVSVDVEEDNKETVDVDESKNNSDYVSVWFKITDLAGNVEYVRTENYVVNCTAPVLNSVTVDGSLHVQAAEGYYNNERTATVVITDRASSFDSTAATNGINIVAKDADGNDVAISKPAMVEWSSNGDVHTATIFFGTDANYTWEISYVNLAGLQMDKTSVVETGDSIYKFVVDKIPSTIMLKQSEEDALYNADSDVKVDVEVKESKQGSGIKAVDYWVENNGVKTQEDNLFTYSGGALAQTEFVDVWAGKIKVDKVKNNSCNVVVYVKVVDNAGNESVSSVRLDIDATSPSVSVTFDNGNDNNGNTYFDAQRVATVVITERTHHFDASTATAGIVINAVDAEGKAVDNAYVISDWTTVENTENPDATNHTATVTFNKDANYTWSITYKDKAGNANSAVTTSVTNGTSVAAFDFTIDTTNPIGTVKAVSSEGRETEWNTLRKELTFGFWSKDTIALTGTFDDLTSAQIGSIEYYKVKSTSSTDETTALTEEQLDAVTDWKSLKTKVHKAVDGTYYTYDGLAVGIDEQFVVYIKLTDLAGNYTYISTNGLIVDHTAPMEETIAPKVTIKPEQPINGIYNGDVKVDIKVTEMLVGGTYTGLNTITYKVFNMGVETQSGELFNFNIENPKRSELIQTWTGSITVDSKLNNSNDVKIVICAKDNSLNESKGDVTIKVDTTAPVIDISYDNNAADNGKYFKDNRTATVVVKERNFNPEDVNITITNSDGVVPTIGQWTKVEGTGNKDNAKWTANVVYSADGDYTFNIGYTDLAGNKCTSISYGDSIASKEFTVDKTLPEISVDYDNNTALNGNYFASGRTATVTIKEHNFNVNRVVFTQKASLNGANITPPTISWKNNGDIHTATIIYSADGDYTFDVTMTDVAGNKSEKANYGNSVAGKEFVVDQTIEKPTIGGVENGKAYTGDVIPVISFSDVNYASHEVTLVRTRLGEKNVNVTEKFINSVNELAQGGSGTYDTFEKIVENDGIYTLTIKMVDKAGNEEVEEVTFTVNRFGSVYVYSDYLVSLIKDGGQYITITGDNTNAITEDLVITEYNADRLLEDSLKVLITRDGQAIDVDFDMNPINMNTEVAIGGSGWYEYVYTIKAANFAEDGVYKISLSSVYATVDSENNESTSVPNNSIDKDGNQILDTMKFTVDTTAPEIRNIVNLDNSNGIADEDKISDDGLKVSYTIVDVGGLKTVEILLNGEVYETIAEFGDSVFNYNGSFYIPEDTKAQTVQIVVTDMAGNVTDTSANEFDTKGVYVFNNKVLVSRNFWVRFINNPVLLCGSIGGVTVVLGALGYFVTARRKRKVK